MPRIFLVFAFLSLVTFSPLALALEPDEVKAKQVYMIDFDTGAVLLSKNPDQKIPTASMSKIMTMYVVFEALKSGHLKLDDTFPVSEKAWRASGSKMFAPLGTQVKVEDLIRGVIIQSGNDAAITLAEGLAGSEEAFAARMNETAQKLGLTNSHFMNASGWPDPNHYSTPRDLAVLAAALIRDFPDEYKYYSEKEFTYNNIKQGNRNPLLYHDSGGDGVKTGHTDEAGYCLIGSGVRDGRRVVFVLTGMKGMQERADEGERVLGWGLGGFVNLSPYANERSAFEIPVALGRTPTVPVTVGGKFTVTRPRLQEVDALLQATYTEPLVAPIKKGDRVGTLQVRMGPQTEPVELPLVAAEDVPSLGLFKRALAKAFYTLNGRKG